MLLGYLFFHLRLLVVWFSCGDVGRVTFLYLRGGWIPFERILHAWGISAETIKVHVVWKAAIVVTGWLVLSVVLMTCILEMILHGIWHVVVLKWLEPSKSVELWLLVPLFGLAEFLGHMVKLFRWVEKVTLRRVVLRVLLSPTWSLLLWWRKLSTILISYGSVLLHLLAALGVLAGYHVALHALHVRQ